MVKATRISLALVALVCCGNGYASPCKPSPSTTAIVASSEISTTTTTISDAEPSTAASSVVISQSASATTTATTSVDEPSSTTILTTSNQPTTTTVTEESSPSSVFVNPSFEDTDASWILEDDFTPLAVSINSGLGRTGSHSAYWSIKNTAQSGRISQRVDLQKDQTYTLSYWWYIDAIEQPSGVDTCFITIIQDGVDGVSSNYPEMFLLPATLPLSTWTKHEISFNSFKVTPAFLRISVFCNRSAGNGLKIAIDDISLAKEV